MYLFISYTQNDIISLTLLIDALHKMGHRTFFGEKLGVNASDWQAQLEVEIAQCDAFIYAVSKTSTNDNWCRWEYRYAVHLGKPIIPVRVEPSPMPTGLTMEQSVSLTRGFTQTAKNTLHERLKTLDIHISPEVAPLISLEPSGVPVHAVAHPVEPNRSRFPLSEMDKDRRLMIFLSVLLGSLLVGSIIISILDRPRQQAEEHINKARNIIEIPVSNSGSSTSGLTNADKRRIDEYNLAATLQPNNPIIYAERGLYYAKGGNTQAAIADYEQLVKLDPKYPSAYARLAALYLQVNGFKKATSAATAAIALDPKNVDLYWDRAYAYNRLKEFDKALADYNYAITLDRVTPKPYSFRGNFYYNNGKYNEAIADFTRAIEISEYSSEAFKWRGFAYQALNRLEDALKDLENALLLRPYDAEVCIALARTYDTLTRYSDALKTYRQCLQRDVNDAQITARIATLQASVTPTK